MRALGKAVVVGVMVLLVVAGLAYFGFIPTPSPARSTVTGITPVITVIDNRGQPSTVGSSASWAPLSVFDSSGRNVTTGSIQVALTGGFGYNGTASSWSITGNMTGITENGVVAGTWQLSASGTGNPPASIPIDTRSGPQVSTTAMLPFQDLEDNSWGSNYGTKSVAFVVNANLAVHGTDGTVQTAAISNIDIGDVNGLSYQAATGNLGSTSTTTTTNTVTTPAALGISAPAGVIGYIEYNVHVSGVPAHGFFEIKGTYPNGAVMTDTTYVTSDLQTWTNGAQVFTQTTQPQVSGDFQYGTYTYTGQWRACTCDSWVSVSTTTTWYQVVGSTSPTQANPSVYYSGDTKDYGVFYGTPTLNSAVAGTGTSLSALQAQFPSNKGYQIYWLIGGYPVGSNLAVAGSTSTTTSTTAKTTTSASGPCSLSLIASSGSGGSCVTTTTTTTTTPASSGGGCINAAAESGYVILCPNTLSLASIEANAPLVVLGAVLVVAVGMVVWAKRR